MEFIHSYAFQHWAVQFLAVLFLAGGLAVLAVGVGLIVCSAGTLRFFAAMNRWVSTRRVLRSLEVSRDTRQAVQKYRRWLAVFFVAGGALAIFGLATAFNARAVSLAFGVDTHASSVASWLVDSVRWVLIVGNLAAIAIGIMLGFFPGVVAALEARGSHWYSDRRLVKGADAMYLPLDNRVAAFPRSAGWIIAVAGLALVGVFGIMLLGIR